VRSVSDCARAVVRGSASIALLSVLSGCTPEPLQAGEWGKFRYVGNVRGSTPLDLIPPTSDRDGNVYVLYGAPALLEAALFVGQVGGGWSGGCTLTSGVDTGVHGWVGHAQERAWYWSGDALVAASGEGDCRQVLEVDPASGAKLRFRAVIPWVLDTPSVTQTVAWVQAVSDPVPYRVVVDLENDVYAKPVAFDPPGAIDIAVLGVGGQRDKNEGVVVVRFGHAGKSWTEARFVDETGDEIARAGVGGLDQLPEYGIAGYLQANDQGLYAGLTTDKQLLVIDKSGGGTRGVGGMDPVGVHRWQGELWLVGVNGNTSLVAHIDDSGNVGGPRTWSASLNAAGGLNGSVKIIDDRSPPSHVTYWGSPRSAMGPAPFVHAHALDHYANDTTGWLVAGPSFQVGGEDRTAIAFAPVGVTYP
jgi:hypothetical protein